MSLLLSLSGFLFDCSQQRIIRNCFIINEAPAFLMTQFIMTTYRELFFPRDLSYIALCRNGFSLSGEEDIFPIDLTL